MRVSRLRACLWGALLLSSGFALWAWLRPYEWSPDTAALCEIQGVNVRLDHSFFWVEPYLKVNRGATHDLSKPVFLLTASGRKLEPADSTFASADGKDTQEIWLKFWLNADEISGPLDLYLNGGKLRLKTRSTAPQKARYFTSNHW